jgi:hypothetical protein
LPTTPAPPLPTDAFNLPSSEAGRLFVVQSGVRSNGQPRVVARSYDNFPWESMRDEDFQPLEVRCASAQSDQCVLVGAVAPTVVEIDVPAMAKVRFVFLIFFNFFEF